MADETEKPEQAETTKPTAQAQPTPLRTLVVRTDGARIEIPFCNMGLWETKAILEEVLALTNGKLREVARAGQPPQAPPAVAAEPVAVEEPDTDVPVDTD